MNTKFVKYISLVFITSVIGLPLISCESDNLLNMESKPLTTLSTNTTPTSISSTQQNVSNATQTELNSDFSNEKATASATKVTTTDNNSNITNTTNNVIITTNNAITTPNNTTIASSTATVSTIQTPIVATSTIKSSTPISEDNNNSNTLSDLKNATTTESKTNSSNSSSNSMTYEPSESYVILNNEDFVIGDDFKYILKSGTDYNYNTEMANKIFNEINNERALDGVPPLKLDNVISSFTNKTMDVAMNSDYQKYYNKVYSNNFDTIYDYGYDYYVELHYNSINPNVFYGYSSFPYKDEKTYLGNNLLIRGKDLNFNLDQISFYADKALSPSFKNIGLSVVTEKKNIQGYGDMWFTHIQICLTD